MFAQIYTNIIKHSVNVNIFFIFTFEKIEKNLCVYLYPIYRGFSLSNSNYIK